jgi:phosphatidylglycerol:prolipoprotein diacylglycerol transferase
MALRPQVLFEMIDIFRSLFAPPRDLILIVAALWIGLVLAEKRSGRHGVSKDALNNLIFYSLIGFVFGGRILFVVANYSAFAESPLNIFSINIDLFDPLSGLLIAILAGFVYARRQNLLFWSTLDALTPIFASLAIGFHLSHLAAGTAFGSPTDLPWGINLWNAMRHPTQIYELIASLIIFGLIWFRISDSPEGLLFIHFLALTAGSRLLLEGFRGDSTLINGGLRFAQIAAWFVLAVAFFTAEAILKKQATG